ncbi:MAG: hypothetical protein KKC01_01840, partial [Gammaproteobacteria bacterium]|nr:hypothetical protein [Gammaproteobacteria bacterium]
NLTVRYDAYNLPTTIQRGSIAQAFNYGPDLQRYRQDSSGTETLYIDKLYERKDSKEGLCRRTKLRNLLHRSTVTVIGHSFSSGRAVYTASISRITSSLL